MTEENTYEQTVENYGNAAIVVHNKKTGEKLTLPLRERQFAYLAKELNLRITPDEEDFYCISEEMCTLLTSD